jgi:hypothetical protein
MANRVSGSYLRFLAELRNLRPTLNPQRITTDFEQATGIAFRTSFPHAVQSGCFFHFCQCLWRRMQQNYDLAAKYVTDAEFALGLRLLPALAFVPLANVIETFEELVHSDLWIDDVEIMRDYLNYFEDTWIGNQVDVALDVNPYFHCKCGTFMIRRSSKHREQIIT